METACLATDWLFKASIALIPLLLGALVTLAWKNSHTLAIMAARFDRNETEIAHLRSLIENRLMPGAKP